MLSQLKIGLMEYAFETWLIAYKKGTLGFKLDISVILYLINYTYQV